ncbi:hypothetical protein JCM8097_003051 [Rhodosporidiobolus ruineniae]
MLRASLSIAALVATGASVDASPIEARAGASIPQKVGQYAYKGCYSDLTNGGTRVLPISLRNPNNTVEGCVSVAIANGYSLAGIEYYGECWVGNKLDSSSKVQGDAACNLVCWGDSKEFCGGQGGSTGAAMQLYSLGATGPVAPVNPTTTTTTTAPAATATFVKKYSSGATNWARSSCQSDLRYGTRALPNQLAQLKSRTVESCLDACTANGYSLCGVEWDGECWGANSLDKTSITLDDSACNKVCADDKTEICGGTGGESGSAFQLFTATKAATTTTATAVPTATGLTGLKVGGSVVKNVDSKAGPAWSNNGCYGDLKYGTRALSHLFAQSTDGTVQGCVNACQDAGYSLCGVEYQGECWGGDSIDVTSSQIDDSVCNLACSGDNTQRCGGSQAAGTPGIAPFGASFQLYAQCGDNVATCDLVNALSCRQPYVLYDGACDSTTCPDGWFNDNFVCKPCNAVDATCTSLTNALTCIPGHVLYKKACNLTQCPQRTFNSNSVCLDCGVGALTCQSATVATKCDVAGGYYLNGATCTQNCGAKAFGNPSSGNCETCSDSRALTCNTSGSTSCISGYIVSNGRCVLDCNLELSYGDHSIPAHYVSADGTQCLPCPKGAIQCNSSGVATMCDAGYPGPGYALKNGNECVTIGTSGCRSYTDSSLPYSGGHIPAVCVP